MIICKIYSIGMIILVMISSLANMIEKEDKKARAVNLITILFYIPILIYCIGG